MLRVIRICIATIMLCLGAQVAQANCMAIAVLESMHSVAQRLARAEADHDLANDILFLQREMELIKTQNLPAAVGPQNIASFEQFINHTDAFLAYAADPSDALRYLKSQTVSQSLREIATLLPELRCRAPEDAPQSVPSDEAGTSLSGIPLNIQLSLRRVLTVTSVLAAAILAAIGVFHWRAQKRRREKRHRIYYQTSYLAKDGKFDGVLLDVSGAGVKLRHDPLHPLKIGTKVNVRILENWAAGTIQWSNPNYSGILFSQPMRTRDVLRLVRAPKQTAPQQKTAPQGDAV